MTLNDLTRLEAKLDDALTTFAKPGDMPPWSVADSYKSTTTRRGQKEAAKSYGLLRDYHWDNSVPSRKGVSKQIAREASKPAVFRSGLIRAGKYLRLGKRGAGPLKKLP